jgi:hypothetical protein
MWDTTALDFSLFDIVENPKFDSPFDGESS